MSTSHLKGASAAVGRVVESGLFRVKHAPAAQGALSWRSDAPQRRKGTCTRQPRFVTHPLGASVSILAVEGEQDLATRQDLRVALEGMFAEGRNVILDLSQATFIDSTILGLLFYTHRRPKRRIGERFAVVVPPGGAADRLFALTGASTVFSTFPSCGEAVAWCAEHPAREGGARSLDPTRSA